MDQLVTTPAGAFVAGVVASDGRVRLTPDVAGEEWWGVYVPDRGTATTERDGVVLAGGRLHPGATAVRVTDIVGRGYDATVGRGAWIVVIEAPGEVLAVHLNSKGRPIAAPYPKQWAREPVPDAGELCPACGGEGWELVSPAEGRPFVACGTCGHEEGTIYGEEDSLSVTLEIDPDATWDEEDEREWLAEQREEDRETLKAAKLSIIVPVGLEVELTGSSGGEGDPVDAITVLHGDQAQDRWIEVESELNVDLVADPLGDAERELLRRLSWNDEIDAREHELSPAAEIVRWRARERAAQRAASQVPLDVGERTITVDGAPVPFSVAAGGGWSVATGEVGSVRVKVVARGIDLGSITLGALSHPLHLLPEPGDDLPAERYRTPQDRRDPLDPARVAELAATTALADHASELAALARPRIVLRVTEDPGRTRTGGEPDLPADMPWPLGGGDDGAGPAAFVGQVDLATLDHDVWPGPREGLLSMFCPIGDTLEASRDGALVVLHAPGTVLERRPFPEALPDVMRFPETAFRAGVGLSIPDWGAAALEDMDIDDVLDEETEGGFDALSQISDWLGKETGYGVPMLGWPTLSQTDVFSIAADSMEGSGPDDWSLLIEDWIEINEDSSDGQRLYVMVPTEDLVAGRFDRAAAYIEHWQ